ncbi:hypothetical protein V7056_06045 [Bacillus sp. JJ664]
MKKLLSYVTAFALALSAFGGFATVGSAETTEVEQNGTKETATNISFSSTGDELYPYETYGTGTFETAEDVDTYKFTLSKDGGIKVQTSVLRTAVTSIELYNEQDETLQSWSLAEGEESIDAFYEGLPAGTYYIKMSVESGTVDNNSNMYSMRVLYWTDNYLEKESNNDPTTATPMTLNKYYTGFTDIETDDIFKITTPSTGKLTIRGSYSPNVALNYLLVNSKYEVVEDWTIEPNETDEVDDIFTVGVAAGTYYVVVTHDPEDEDANEYYMTQAKFVADNYSEKENNETTTTATPVALKRAYNGILSWKSDIDTYKLNMPATANVTLNMSQAPYTAFKAVLVNSSNKVVKTFYTKAGKSNNVSLGNINLAKGTYYLKVSLYKGNYEQVAYKLNLQPKVMWGKIEYKPGMTGKTVAVATTKIYKLKSGKLVYYKTIYKGAENGVYGTDKYGYKLGNSLYIKKSTTVKYYTVPSSIKTSYTLVNK